MYLQGVLPWNSQSWVAPPPEEIARIRKEAGTEIPVDGGEDAIAPHMSREDREALEAARQEKERELDRSSGETEQRHESSSEVRREA